MRILLKRIAEDAAQVFGRFSRESGIDEEELGRAMAILLAMSMRNYPRRQHGAIWATLRRYVDTVAELEGWE